MGKWEEGNWIWNLKWRRRLRDWEAESLNDLFFSLCRFKPSTGDDHWTWKGNNMGRYTTSSAYKCIEQRQGHEEDPNSDIFQMMWKTKVDPKIKLLAWRLFRKRVPTLVELQKRGCTTVGNEAKCASCIGHEETIEHRFFCCLKSKYVWQESLRWIDAQYDNYNNFSGFLRIYRDYAHSKTQSKFVIELWLCLVWEIWKERNMVIFKGIEWDAKRMVGEIRAKMWSWWKWKRGYIREGASFKDWIENPFLCLP